VPSPAPRASARANCWPSARPRTPANAASSRCGAATNATATQNTGFALHVAFDLAEGLVCLTLPLPAEPRFPDLAPSFPAANRMQRAVRDLLGIQPDAGDNAPGCATPTGRPTTSRCAATRRTSASTKNEDYAFVRVEGDGVHEIAVGPIHAGIIEPGHFRFSVMGESVLRLEERLGWKHKGIERRFVGMGLAEGARLAGRVSGDSTVAYAWAYCQAAEAIGGTTPPPRACGCARCCSNASASPTISATSATSATTSRWPSA
jgi:hypothetical protein